MSCATLLPFDLLHAIIGYGERDNLRAWSLVSWECFATAGRLLSSTIEVPPVETKYKEFFRKMTADALSSPPLLPQIAHILSLPHSLTHLTLHLPYASLPLPALPSNLIETPHPLASLTLILPEHAPSLSTSHAPLLALFAPRRLVVQPSKKGAEGLFNFVVQSGAHEVVSDWVSDGGPTRQVVMRRCNLLSDPPFPNRKGSAVFFASSGEEGEEAEVVWDLRGVSFGRNFFDYFVGVREGEGSIGGGGSGGRRTVVVEDEERKGRMMRGMERKPPGGKVAVEVGEVE